MYNVMIFDMPSCMDRYTILVDDGAVDSRGRECYDMWFSGVEPEGMSGYCGTFPKGGDTSCLGDRVDMADLPANARRLVERLMKEP